MNKHDDFWLLRHTEDQKLHMKRRGKNLLMGMAKTIDASQSLLLAPADSE